MIVGVTGGRYYGDPRAVHHAFSCLHERFPIDRVISGACVDKRTGELAGADRYAIEWAIHNEIDFNGRPARWLVDGHPGAGPLRNARMARHENIQTLIWFPGGPGTANMISQARQVGTIKILEGEHPERWVF